MTVTTRSARAMFALLVFVTFAISSCAKLPSTPPIQPRSPLRTPAELVGSAPVGRAAALSAAFAGGNALPAVALVTVIPCLLALWKQAYAFTYSYGLSVSLVGGALLLYPPGGRALSQGATAHLTLLCAYGARLVAFLAYRQWSWKDWSKIVDQFDDNQTPLLSRLALAVSVSLFYALLCAPGLFHAQHHPTSAVITTAGLRRAQHHPTSAVTTAGLALAAFSLTVETVADAQKSALKVSNPNGPVMSGLFSLVRHVNYLAEIGFWLGSYVTALPSIAAAASTCSAVGTAGKILASTLGLAGITTIMLGASKRLDNKQMAKYGQRPDYQAYLKRTPALFPKFG